MKSCPKATRPMMSSLCAREVRLWGASRRRRARGTYVAVEAYSMMFTVAAPPAERTWFVSLLSSYDPQQPSCGVGGERKINGHVFAYAGKLNVEP